MGTAACEAEDVRRSSFELAALRDSPANRGTSSATGKGRTPGRSLKPSPLGLFRPTMGSKAEVGLALLGVQVRGVYAAVLAALQTFGFWCRQHPEVGWGHSGQQPHLGRRHLPATC